MSPLAVHLGALVCGPSQQTSPEVPQGCTQVRVATSQPRPAWHETSGLAGSKARFGGVQHRLPSAPQEKTCAAGSLYRTVEVRIGVLGGGLQATHVTATARTMARKSESFSTRICGLLRAR